MLLVIIFVVLIIFILSIKISLCTNIDKSKHEFLVKIYVLRFFCISSVDVKTLKEKFKGKINGKFKGKLNSKKIRQYSSSVVRKLPVTIEKFHAEIDIFTGDAVLTSYLVAIISTAIPIVIKILNFKIRPRKFYYKVIPFFTDKNVVNIKFECIISINFVHIIITLVKLMKEWRSEVNGRKSSNRKTYGNCYE